jgi:DNA-binding NtrC family response regulator
MKITGDEKRNNSRHTVLLVDTGDTVRHGVSDILNSYGYQVITSTDAREMLAGLGRRIPIDVIISDDWSSRASGLEFVGTLIESASDIPVIVLTSNGSLEDYLNVIKLGAYDYLQKPVTPQELSRIVHAAISAGMRQV